MPEPSDWAWCVDAAKRYQGDLRQPVFALSPLTINAVDAEMGRLRAALAFAADAIKRGDPWTPEAEEMIAPLLTKGEG